MSEKFWGNFFGARFPRQLPQFFVPLFCALFSAPPITILYPILTHITANYFIKKICQRNPSYCHLNDILTIHHILPQSPTPLIFPIFLIFQPFFCVFRQCFCEKTPSNVSKTKVCFSTHLERYCTVI